MRTLSVQRIRRVPFGAREGVLGFHPLYLGLGSVEALFHAPSHFLHIPGQRDERFSTFSVEAASTLEDLLDFSLHHTATALARPHHLERVRVALLSNSFSCAVIAWLLGHWAKAASYLSFTTDPSAMRSLFCANVKQLCRRVTHRRPDVRLDSGQLMRPDARPRQPTDPSRWTWKLPQLEMETQWSHRRTGNAVRFKSNSLACTVVIATTHTVCVVH